MPIRLCLDPRCAQSAVYRGRCAEHARRREREIGRAGHGVYHTKRWRITRERFLLDHPLCDCCGQIATDVHHRVDIADGGAIWDHANLQALCGACHGRITRRRQT